MLGMDARGRIEAFGADIPIFSRMAGKRLEETLKARWTPP